MASLKEFHFKPSVQAKLGECSSSHAPKVFIKVISTSLEPDSIVNEQDDYVMADLGFTLLILSLKAKKISHPCRCVSSPT